MLSGRWEGMVGGGLRHTLQANCKKTYGVRARPRQTVAIQKHCGRAFTVLTQESAHEHCALRSPSVELRSSAGWGLARSEGAEGGGRLQGAIESNDRAGVGARGATCTIANSTNKRGNLAAPE